MKLSKKCLWRIIATVGCFGYLIFLFSSYFILLNTNYKIPELFVLVSTILDLASYVYLLIFPLNYIFYIAWAILFSIFSVFFGFSLLGMNLLMPGLDLAKYYGFFKKRKKLKYGIIIIIYTGLLISLIRFDIKFLLISVLQIMASLTITVIIKVTRIEGIKKKSLSPENTKELFAFANLKEREINFLIEVLKNKKYSEIADKYYVSVSTVKQELISAYKKLGVCSQKDFIKKYGNIEIIEKAFNITKN